MYKLCKTEQSAARQRQLEAGLLEAMRTERYEDISISDLCAHMQIPRKSFYRYFSSKDGALHALLDHTLMEFEGFATLTGNGAQRTLVSDLESFFAFWLNHRELLTVLDKSNLSGILIERAITHSLQETVMPSRFLPDDSKEMQKQITIFGVCGLMSMVLIWHHEGYQKTPGEMAAVAARMMGQPLFPNAEKYM